MTLPVGTSLEKYEILEVLGQGGGGISYKAIDKQLNREVVLKEHFPLGHCHRTPGSALVEPTEKAPFERSLHSFCREARVLASLNHPSIVRIYEVFGACGTAFLVTDYIKGKSLQAWMAKKPSGKRIKQVLVQLLDALAYLHAAGVIHRDIKPDNILIQENDEPVLIDFGAALQGNPTHTLTLIGTPAYAAPEQFRENTIPGPPADIFALGKSFLITARTCGVKLPRPLPRTLRKATMEAAEKRYQNAEAWKQALSGRHRLIILLCSVGLLISLLLAWQYHRKKQMENLPMHPIQLVHYNPDGFLIREGTTPLPPREEAFVTALLAIQKEYHDSWKQMADAQQGERKLSANDFNKQVYQLQKQVNDKAVALIEQYLQTHYKGNDPYEEWTEILIDLVKNRNLEGILMYTRPPDRDNQSTISQ